MICCHWEIILLLRLPIIYSYIRFMVRKANESDFNFFYGLYMHPEINPWLLYEMMPEEEFHPIFSDLLRREALYVFTKEGEPAGMFKLVPQKFRNSHIMYLGGVAIVPSQSGKGYGKEMVLAAVALAFSMGCVRIELTVATTNFPAIALYESAGFVTEGILRKYTFLKAENRYMDEQVMALVKIEG